MKSGETIYEIRRSLRKQYTQIVKEGKPSPTANDKPADRNYTYIADQLIGNDYEALPGYMPEADLRLGCGLPTRYADIKNGDIVVDVGSGAGNDCFVARSMTGESGKVIGIDFTKEMVKKATGNAQKMGFENVQFKVATVENIPIDSGKIDVVISNCVLNLVSDKRKGFEEIFRILKPGGYFVISDVVFRGNPPKKLAEKIKTYMGCMTEVIKKKDYLKLIRYMAFRDITVLEEKKITIPKHIARGLPSRKKKDMYSYSELISITVQGKKPIPRH